MWRSFRSRSHRVVLAIFAGLNLTPAAPAHATVWEVTDDGAIILRSSDLKRPAQHERRAHAVPANLRESFALSAAAHDIARSLVEAVAWTESRFRRDARSPAGAIGVMQLMPRTAAQLGIDPADTPQNIEGGTAYLKQLLDRYRGDTLKALAAYNAGPGAIDRYGGVPPYPETKRYVATVLDRLTTAAIEMEAQP